MRLHRSWGRANASVAALFGAWLLARPASAQERDEWQMVRLDDAKAGFNHIVVEKVTQDGKTLWKTSTDGSLTINRFGTNVTVIQSGWVLEDESGAYLEGNFEENSTVQNSVTHVKVDGAKATVRKSTGGPAQIETIDWDRAWRGPVAEERFEREQVAAKKTEFSFPSYSAETGPVTNHFKVLGKKKVKVPGGDERELLQLHHLVDEHPEMIDDDWRDDAGVTVMSVLKVIGMNIVTTPAPKAECLAAFAKPETPEIFDKLSPRSNVRLPEPRRADEVVLHLKALDPEMPLPKLEDERQHVIQTIAKDEIVLRVERVVPDRAFTLPLSNFTPEEQECLAPNLQIESDFPGIVELAKKSVAGETDAWKAAGKLERCADDYISNKSMKSLFWTAKDVFEKKAGDCTEHGVFLAALCRAAGIPARVACGFLYFQGIWGGHMWTEVSLGGKWYALDATLGHGSVDAGHLRLGADSLKSTQIDRLMSGIALGMTMKIDLVSFRHGKVEVQIGEDFDPYVVEGEHYKNLLFHVGLRAPEGFEIRPNEKIRLGDEKIVDLVKPGGMTIEVTVSDVPYDFNLDQLAGQFTEQGTTRVKGSHREIDGRPARLFQGKLDGKQRLIAAALRDQSLVMIAATLLSSDDEKSFNSVVDSLELDDERKIH